jgi:hypothetical protein
MWRDLGQELLGDDWLGTGWQTVAYLFSLWLSAWWIGRKVFHPWLVRAVKRPQEFFIHPDRGRLTALVRRLVRNSQVEGALRETANEATSAQRQRLAGEVSGQLSQVARSLSERQREMNWLSNQLEGYLRLHGVEDHLQTPRFNSQQGASPVLFGLETSEELQSIASAHPRNEAQYSHVQRRLKILADWNERFSRTFLDPHRFLDQVAEAFPAGVDESRLSAGLVRGVRQFENFPASFQWLQTADLPQQIAFCSAPQYWQRLNSVMSQLVDSGFRQRMSIRPKGERLFLVQARLGIPQTLIRASAEQVPR